MATGLLAANTSNQAEAATIDTSLYSSITASTNPETGKKGTGIPSGGYYATAYSLRNFTMDLSGLIQGNPTRIDSNHYLESGQTYTLCLNSLSFQANQVHADRHLVVTDASGTILGYSTNTTENKSATTFSLIGIGGASLIVSTSDKLTFNSVLSSNMSNIINGDITNINQATVSDFRFEGGSQGIIDYGSGSGRFADKDTSFLTNAGGTTEYRYGVATTLHFSDPIPEPTTATLSLLGLGALLLRRRRMV